ncbi:MAG: hypothetical protein C5S45_05965 [Candidatus Methanocomedens sp.]|nr:MAG: hypothetical protein C5S45_05965 [ANME-2 cluster archaeon]
MLFQELAQALTHQGLHNTLDIAVAQFGLGLALELGIG